jgi:hypothetical protein
MPPVTLKVLASVLQMNSPDAAITSDNQGLKALLADVKEQLAEEANMASANDPDAIEAYVMTADGGQGGRLILARKNTGAFGKATTIFRKGGYGKSVYGPQHRRVFDD